MSDKSRKKPPPVTVKNLAVPAFAAATAIRFRMRHPFIKFPRWDEVPLFPELRQMVVHFLRTETGKAKQHWPKLIKRAYPELTHDPLEDMLLKLVVRSYIIRSRLLETSPARMHDCIEFCPGQGNLTLGCCLA